MKKNIPIIFIALLVMVSLLLIISRIYYTQDITVTPTPSNASSYFPKAADEIFVSSVVPNQDLNTGITIEFATFLLPEQRDNVSFTVLNHTDESIKFTNQGFGLTIFGYDDINQRWESLELQHIPYAEPKILPPKLERWDPEINNSWDILENDVAALDREFIRLYISGVGEATNKTYGAYADVRVSRSP